METKNQKKKKFNGVSASIIILGCFIIAFCFFQFVCGNPANFDEKGHPNGSVFGTLYQGGYVIPIVMTLLLTVISLSVERFIALRKARGTGNLVQFVEKSKDMLEAGDLEGARELCDKQQGSVANILRAALVRYEDIDKMDNLSNDEKAEIVGKEVEDATTLELPVMEQNLSVIATISTLGTLFGLFGTVLGMIRSFAAMGQEGAPDSTKLAIGISEALMNTAMGIGTGAAAIIAYGYFSGKVQDITNAVNEIAFAIGQTFTTRKNK